MPFPLYTLSVVYAWGMAGPAGVQEEPPGELTQVQRLYLNEGGGPRLNTRWCATTPATALARPAAMDWP